MPSLTVQYNSDSATVELSRDCGEEGTRHMTCRGKQDRDFILNELTCIDEAESLGISMDNTIKPSTDMLSDSHKKSVELIQNIPSDNNEDNAIDLTVNQIEQSPEKYADKFNVEEIMFGDQPIITDDVTTEKDAEVIKPTKVLKKLSVKEKLAKKTANLMRDGKDTSSESPDELMMGDQPALTLEEIVKEDSKGLNDNQNKDIFSKPATKEAIIVENTSEVSITADTTVVVTEGAKESSTEATAKTATTVKTTVAPKPTANAKITNAAKIIGTNGATKTTVLPKTTTLPKSSTIAPTTTAAPTQAPTTVKEVDVPSTTPAATTEATEATTTSTTQAAIKITKKSFNTVKRTSIDNEDVLLLNNKEKKREESALTNDHFIPPMLLVRTMFNPSNAHAEHNDTENAIINETTSAVPSSTLSTVGDVSSTTEKSKIDSSSVATEETVTTIAPSTTSEPSTSTLASSTSTEASTVPTLHTEAATETSLPTETTQGSTASSAAVTDETTTVHLVQQQQESGHIRPPHAPKYSSDPQQHGNQPSTITSISASTATGSTIVSETVTGHDTEAPPTTIVAPTNDSHPVSENDKSQKLIASVGSTISTPVVPDSSIVTESTGNPATTLKQTNLVPVTNPTPEPFINATQAPLIVVKEVEKRLDQLASAPSAPTTLGPDPEDTSVDHSSDLNNAENLQPYRPNRRRDLTKPESRSYLKKIFG